MMEWLQVTTRSHWCDVLRNNHSAYRYAVLNAHRSPALLTCWQFVMLQIKFHQLAYCTLLNIIFQRKKLFSCNGIFFPISFKECVEPLKGFTSVKYYPQHQEIKSEWVFFILSLWHVKKNVRKMNRFSWLSEAPRVNFNCRFLGQIVINFFIRSETRTLLLYLVQGRQGRRRIVKHLGFNEWQMTSRCSETT